jgi:hypothetical protein
VFWEKNVERWGDVKRTGARQNLLKRVQLGFYILQIDVWRFQFNLSRSVHNGAIHMSLCPLGELSGGIAPWQALRRLPSSIGSVELCNRVCDRCNADLSGADSGGKGVLQVPHGNFACSMRSTSTNEACNVCF